MQTKDGSGFWVRVTFALALLLTLAVLLQPAVSHAAPLGADTVVYVVKPGDTLRSIAAAHGTTIGAIVRANNMANPDVIYPGQRLTIPVRSGSAPVAGPAPTAAAKPTVGASVYHTVKLGDTLDKVARAYGTSAAAIIAANGIRNPDLIWVGQKLLISGSKQPGASAPQPTVKPKPQPAPASQQIYVVQAGDTLGQIAKRYGTTVAAIVAANGLPSANTIGVGQRLIISKGGGSAPVTVVRPTKFVVSISQQRCWLYAGDALIAKWVCSTGRRSSPRGPAPTASSQNCPKPGVRGGASGCPIGSESTGREGARTVSMGCRTTPKPACRCGRVLSVGQSPTAA